MKGVLGDILERIGSRGVTPVTSKISKKSIQGKINVFH